LKSEFGLLLALPGVWFPPVIARWY